MVTAMLDSAKRRVRGKFDPAVVPGCKGLFGALRDIVQSKKSRVT